MNFVLTMMNFLACFVPGMLALGAAHRPDAPTAARDMQVRPCCLLAACYFPKVNIALTRNNLLLCRLQRSSWTLALRCTRHNQTMNFALKIDEFRIKKWWIQWKRPGTRCNQLVLLRILCDFRQITANAPCLTGQTPICSGRRWWMFHSKWWIL